VLLVSVLMAATGFATYYWFGEPAITAGAGGHEVDVLRLTQAQTAAFISIQLLHLGFLATARSIYQSAFTFSPFSNRWVLLGMGLTCTCILLIVYVPALQGVFRTAPLPLAWWPVLLLGLLPGFVGVEIEKALRHRWGRRVAPANSG
jgi:magnesium-transporting ATPase (P-type)